MSAQPISSIIIAGGGIVGWSAAAALRRQLPMVQVTVLPLAPPPDALADRIGPTLPSIDEFHRDLRLGEADTVVRAGSGLRLGTRFEGWSERAGDYIHAYGGYGRPLGTAAFHHYWVRAAEAGSAAPFDAHSAAAALAAAARFAPARLLADAQVPEFGYGLTIDPPRYRAMMRALALHLGAVERQGALATVRLRADGFVQELVLADGGTLAADLFVDATGPAALVRGQLDQEWESWAEWLPADRILLAESAPNAEAPLDRAIAMADGWRWEAPSPAHTSHGFVYASRHCSDARAVRVLRNAASAEPAEPPIALRQGRRPQPWLRNCLALGDAALAIEPLEWTNLHLAHSAIDRMIAMLPDRDCSPVELWDFNRQTETEAIRVRDFLVLHYATAHRPSDRFWCEAAGAEPPATLAHTLTQWRERGRLPFYEDETFSRDNWCAVLLGQGVRPRRTDPLIETLAPERSEEAMRQLRQAIQRLVEAAPSYAASLQILARQVSP